MGSARDELHSNARTFPSTANQSKWPNMTRRHDSNVINEPPRSSISKTPYASDLSSSLNQPLDLTKPCDHQTPSGISPLHLLSLHLCPPLPFSSLAVSTITPASSISLHSPPLQSSSLLVDPATSHYHVPTSPIPSWTLNDSSPPMTTTFGLNDMHRLENTAKRTVPDSLGNSGRGRAPKREVPPNDRDESYFQRRERNNAAAQKSRKKKKLEEEATRERLRQTKMKYDDLMKKNITLNREIIELKGENEKLRAIILGQYIIRESGPNRPC